MELKSKHGKYKTKYIKMKKYTLGINEKGFLCSCNNHEKKCIRESYVILNKYADKLYESTTMDINTVHTPNDILYDNLEDELQEEIANLKSDGKGVNPKRFQVVDSGAKHFLFIRTNIDDPVLLASNIIKDICYSQQLQTRYLIRLIPIEATCKAYITNIKKTCSELLDKHFKNSAQSFSIIYNHRNNKTLSRDLVIKEIAELVGQTRNDHVVNLNDADISIVIEVIKSIALLAVIPNYLKYKKFNLHGVCNLKNNEHKKGVESEDKDVKEPVVE